MTWWLLTIVIVVGYLVVGLAAAFIDAYFAGRAGKDYDSESFSMICLFWPLAAVLLILCISHLAKKVNGRGKTAKERAAAKQIEKDKQRSLEEICALEGWDAKKVKKAVGV